MRDSLIRERKNIVLNWKSIATIQIAVAGAGTAYLVGYCLQAPITPLRSFGLVIVCVSFALWMTARIQLGKSFSIAPKATALVTRGIYSKMRNPIYVFSAAWIGGLTLALGKPVALLIVVPLIPVQWARARTEARVLEENFGEEYREYRWKTWF
jgi:protein-S-isoprenylcysteine O-methyltransferase Ste14